MRGPNVVMPPLGILGQNEQKYRDRRGRMDVRDGDHQREPDPGLWVKERFFDVIPFPLMVFDALLIHPQSAVCQEPKKCNCVDTDCTFLWPVAYPPREGTLRSRANRA